uniref:Uncharacterized protein n=1 Tax=Physcomitrium patens TaxID=3218 RepID=A0A2K1IFY2_PHYPA|nr:hypothetical protein PHYPA_028769 [Physcomitrium patens]
MRATQCETHGLGCHCNCKFLNQLPRFCFGAAFFATVWVFEPWIEPRKIVLSCSGCTLNLGDSIEYIFIYIYSI